MAPTAAAAAPAPGNTTPIEVRCSVLRDGSVFSVTIAPSAIVWDLQVAIAQVLNTSRCEVAPYELTLYTANDAGHAQREIGADTEMLLAQDAVRTADCTELYPHLRLDGAECGGPTGALRRVLVETPHEAFATKRRRLSGVQWEESEEKFAPARIVMTTIPSEETGEPLTWVTMPHDFLRGTGFVGLDPDHDFVLYQRREMEDQWTMIQTCALDAHAALYIVGPPGSGKTSAAYAFACSQVDRQQWIVVWIHSEIVGSGHDCYVVKFDGDQKATALLLGDSIVDHIRAMLGGLRQPNRGVIVFYDGYVESNEMTGAVQGLLQSWHHVRPKDRRFVCISSMTWLKGYKPETFPTIEAPSSWPPRLSTGAAPLECLSVMKFRLLSWTLDQYMDAVRYDRFFESVQSMLDAPVEGHTASARSPSRLVMDKYEVAGGSARFMFRTRTTVVVQAIDETLQAAPNLHEAMEIAGAWWQPVVNRLYAQYSREKKVVTELVSLYLARLGATTVGGRMIRTYEKLLTVDPSLGGHMLEGWFFLSLASSGLECCDRDTRDVQRWEKSAPRFFDPCADPFYLHAGWNIPVKWSEAGYDAVYWEETPVTGKHRLVFVQMTRAKTQQYDPDPFLQVTNRLNQMRERASRSQTKRDKTQVVDCISLYFVVPMANLDTSTIPTNATDFQRKVMDAASAFEPSVVECEVRVVGVGFEMHDQAPRGWGFHRLGSVQGER